MVLMDFVAPRQQFRDMAKADYTIWMNTIEEGRYEDTNKIFRMPTKVDIEVKEWIDLDQLRSSLEDFSRGIKGIQ